MPHVAVALEMLAIPCNEQIASKKCHLLATSVKGFKLSEYLTFNSGLQGTVYNHIMD